MIEAIGNFFHEVITVIVNIALGLAGIIVFYWLFLSGNSESETNKTSSSDDSPVTIKMTKKRKTFY
jgi:hypothetical protein